MERIKAKEITLPLNIPAERIGLPTSGATIGSCRFVKAGTPDERPFAKQFGFVFPADTYVYEGAIHPVDPEAPDILFEAGLPAEWNGKMIQQGGAGIDGYVPPCSQQMHGQTLGEKRGLSQGYAMFASDGGYEYPGGNPLDTSWALNEECFRNYAFHSLKKAKDTAAALVEAVYGRSPERVYFYGGSNGGRECMKAIQNFPEDYDGAVCFFPVLYWVLKILKDMQLAHLYADGKPGVHIDQETYHKIKETVLTICGGRDGVIPDWQGAKAHAGEVREALKELLTAEQLEYLTEFTKPMKLNFPLYYGDTELPGYLPFSGADLYTQHFAALQLTQQYGVLSLSDRLLAAAVLKDSKAPTKDFDPEQWKEQLLAVSEQMDAYSADIDAFRNKGGKLILVQGAVDQLVTEAGTEAYAKRLRERYGEELDSFFRFYVAPGYDHNMEGPVKITADFIGMLDHFVEENLAPEEITVTDIFPGAPERSFVLKPLQ